MDLRGGDSRRSSSSSSTSGVKNKWIKAFRSLKLTTVGSSNRNEVSHRDVHSRISAQLGLHAFQEYTYKKITACDVCREILRGHARQGLKCKLCKLNVHSGSCQENAPKCQPKPRLLRKQKSASELETKIAIPQIEDEPGSNQTYDPMYQSLRATAETRKGAAMYVSDGYMASAPAYDMNETSISLCGKNQTSMASAATGANSSTEGSSNNISNTTTSDRTTNVSNVHKNGHMGSMGNIAPVTTITNHDMIVMSHRNSDEFHHYQLMQQQQPPPQQSIQQQQQQQQQPVPPPLPHIRYNHNQHYGVVNNNPELSSSSISSATQLPRQHIKQNSPALLQIAQAAHQAYSAPHSPQRKKLTLRMKSLSLDSPESVETLKDKRSGSGYPSTSNVVHTSHTPPYEPTVYEPIEVSNYKYKVPPPPSQSPAMSKRFKLAMHGRMCSIESDPTLMMDMSSISPCPSPKPQRLLPTNIFVVLYSFRSRQLDELNLRAGYMVTVIDTTDPEWWQGKCLGNVGYFPSNYVTKLFPGERPLQVIHTVQVNDGDFAIKLIREQIVIQVAEEVNGIIMVRTGINDNIVPCPSKYLQEITL